MLPMPESKMILSMRLKAKNFIQKQRELEEAAAESEKQDKQLDPNNFTCKFCNGGIDAKSLKFVHEKFCLVASKNPITTEPELATNSAEKKTQKKKKITDCSTQGESEGTIEEDK